MLSFRPTFSLSSFTFIKRLFSSPSLSAIRVVSSAYLKLLIFLSPRDPTETETELCLSVSCGGTGQKWTARGSGCSRLGYGITSLGGGHHEPHHRAARTYTGLGNRHLEGTKRALCTSTQEKGAVTLQETDPDLPVSVQESLAGVFRVGRWWPAAGSGALNVAVYTWGLLKEVAIIFITSTIA